MDNFTQGHLSRVEELKIMAKSIGLSLSVSSNEWIIRDETGAIITTKDLNIISQEIDPNLDLVESFLNDWSNGNRQDPKP